MPHLFVAQSFIHSLALSTRLPLSLCLCLAFSLSLSRTVSPFNQIPYTFITLYMILNNLVARKQTSKQATCTIYFIIYKMFCICGVHCVLAVCIVVRLLRVCSVSLAFAHLIPKNHGLKILKCFACFCVLCAEQIGRAALQ